METFRITREDIIKVADDSENISAKMKLIIS